MGIPCVPYEPASDKWENHPFPRRFSSEPYVLYHGTSSVFEAAIEAKGLAPNAGSFARSDLQRLADIFDGIGWSGSSGASLAVLKPFTLAHDYSHENGKPVYLAEGAKRALRFASADFAGGEVARTVYYCFKELRTYLEEPAVRADHVAKWEASDQRVRSAGGVGLTPLPLYDADLVAQKLRDLAHLEFRANEVRSEHSFGLVYAVQFRPGDLHGLEFHSAMGVKSYALITPDQLVAKLRAPKDYSQPFGLQDGFDLPSRKGILAELRE